VRCHVKIGTEPRQVVELHGDYFADDGAEDPPALDALPEVGARVSWTDLPCGEWTTGIVDDLAGELVMIRRL